MAPYRAGLAAMLFAASAAPALAGGVTEVHIAKLAFTPAEVTVHVGDTIQWINDDFVAHTATAKSTDGTPGLDVMIPAHKTGQWLPPRAGAIEYYCRFHPGMKARIIVLGD